MEANGRFVEIPQYTLDEAAAASSELLPMKITVRYIKEYEVFTTWSKTKNVCDINKGILLCYVTKLWKMFAPSTLWAKISMLKTYLKHSRLYEKVFTLLRSKSKCYIPNTAKILITEKMTKYLLQASDEQDLLEKVITIFGIFGACRREELLLLCRDKIENAG
ncbi:hypothetical protein RN001_003794 [Aquatica leii]|uniref:Uncharacterized protein n=1 Tax=Aquatica leii TaxID=1421715 RepID=A0AAN7QPA5_9COLE|nr:hypothetical protein RN001_003794 [Aquatica leii]